MNTSVTPRRTRVLPPVYFLMAIVLMVVLNRVLPLAEWISSPLSRAGWLPIVTGLTLGLVGNVQFRRSDTTIKPFEESSTVVTTGVFAFSRNPMYLGMTLMLVGTGVLLGTVAPFVVVPAFVWWITRRFIIHEEAMLEAKFGDIYKTYKRSVRRWI